MPNGGLFDKHCSSCGKKIVWIKDHKSGSSIPLDAKPELRYVTDIDQTRGELLKTYTSHFATCPNAAQHRKPRS